MKQVSLKSPRLSSEEKFILLTFIFTLLSGAIRKWVISSGAINNGILFLQLLIPIFLFYHFFKKGRRLQGAPLVVLYLLYLLMSAFNYKNQTLYHGLLGIILHSGFWLALFAYIPIRRKIQIHTLIPYFLWLCIIQVLLGIFQYFLPKTHVLNRYVAEVSEEDIARVGEAVRVTGSFSYISGFGAFVIFLAIFSWIYPILVKKRSSIQYILPLLTIIAALLNGSRGILAVVIICLFLSIIYSGAIEKSFRLIIFSVLLTIGAYFSSVRIQNFVNATYENFMTRVVTNQETGEQQRRIYGPIENIINFSGNYPIFGVGLGSTYQGANLLWGTSPYVLSHPGGVEQEGERIIVEGGYILLFFKLALLFTFAIYWYPPWGVKLAFIGLIMLYTPIVYNTFNAYFLIIGFILLDHAYIPRMKLNTVKSNILKS